MSMGMMIVALVAIVIGLPVVLGIWSDVYKRQLKFREREMELMSQQTAEKAAQYAAHTERLEQRVRVLEQIVTDKGLQTADQIEALRAPRLTSNDLQ
jgi:FtsZ-interacting cell division protein ZipA